MDITNVKAMVAKVFTIGALAGAVVLASPSKAQAQVSFGIHVGTPVRQVYAPSYGYVQPAYGYGYAQPRYDDERYEARRRYEYQRQQAYLREQQHEQWEQRERWEQHERQERHEQHERAEHGYYGYNR